MSTAIISHTMEKSSDNRTMQDTALKKESSEKLGAISNSDQSAKENGGHNNNNGKSTASPFGDDGDHTDSNENSHSKQLDDGLIALGQEVEEGNVEYKLKLVDPTPERFEGLVSQLKWRLGEGQGEALYEIGVEDSGFPKGLCDSDLEKSINTLERMAKQLNCECSLVCKRPGKEGTIAEMLVREVREDRYIDIRIAVTGNVDSGKSTLIGVLTKGQLDNGRGLVRVNVFNHKHEVETGRTSSISTQILGYDSKGECVNYSPLHNMSWGDIIEHSYKVISFLDLAGHEKYLRTTVTGMTGHMPDYCFLLVGSNMGVTRMTKEHLGLALALKIPVVIIVTKVDICPENVLKQTLEDIQRILKVRGVRKMSMIVKNEEDMITCIKNIHNDRIVPIFLLSSVTGKNVEILRQFLNVIPPRIQWDLLVNGPPEVLIDQTYFVTGVGTVVGGTVMSGTIQAEQKMLLGPDGNGQFIPVQVKSVHSKRVPVKSAWAGQSAGFALKKIKRSLIRKGMVLVDANSNPKASFSFEADVIILFHSTTIHTNYQPVIQCMTMRQSARITHIFDRELLRTGDRARVRFRFLYRSEFLKEGMRIIFREGRCKGIGIITKVHCEDEDANKPAQTVSLTESGGVAKPEEGGANNNNKVDAELKEQVAPEVEVRVDEAKGRKKEEKDRKKAAASKAPQQPAKKK
eukprot:TRINITY_DN1418_c0_g1_i1.p1 TRINITY_DN1418_c0_g1~~TRINITY_DN1418_c0_g1_i1.p1  ORF type:complete len:688 (-),score=173.48 TRINITY_DN1418_c0_g1_i1:161-2224(-)